MHARTVIAVGPVILAVIMLMQPGRAGAQAPSGSADVSVSTSGNQTAGLGATVNSFGVISNAGPDTATNVQIDVFVPSALSLLSHSLPNCTQATVATGVELACLLSTLPAGSGGAVSWSMAVQATAVGAFDVTFAIAADQADPVANNFSAFTVNVLLADLAVGPQPPLTLALGAAAVPLLIGPFTNLGPTTSIGGTIEVVFPSFMDLSFIGGPTVIGHSYNCDLYLFPIPSLAPVVPLLRCALLGNFSSSDSALISIGVSSDVIASGTIDVTIFSNVVPDPNAANNSTSIPVTATAPSDATAPEITPTLAGTAGSNGWFVSDVDLSWAVTDPESAVTSNSGCGPVAVVADTGGATFTCSATSAGGTASVDATIRRDATPPTIIASADRAPNAAGWYDAPVTVSFVCADATSGVASCPAPVAVSADGLTTVAGTAADLAGNTAATSLLVRVDGTPPVLSFVGNAGTYSLSETIAISCSASDAISGIALVNCPSIAGTGLDFGPGTHTFTADATDLAGNSATATTTFAVVVTPADLATLVTTVVRSPGVQSGLLAKLAAAEAAAARGNQRAKDGAIRAFINQVRAQTGKSIDPADAALLILLAQQL